MKEQLALLPGYLLAHLELTLAALLVGVAVSLPLGVALTRVRALERPVLAITSVIQTIPSLALLAVMVPLLAALHLQAIGYVPAFVGLVLYSLMPMLRNTVTGLSGVDPACIEAARGVGMTPMQSLWRVELPLAMPTILAGVRTATVWTVGAATLSTPVGATSLGNYIFSGLQTRNLASVIVGCAAAALLALALDALVRLLGLAVAGRRRAALTAVLAAFAVLGGATAAAAIRGASSPAAIVVGSKTFTEQYILSDVLADLVEERTHLPVRTVQSLGSTVLFDGLRAGEIDAYVDYTGTLWTAILHHRRRPADRRQVLEALGRELMQRYDIVLVGPLGFENAYTLAMRRRDASQLGVRTISDLASVSETLSMGGDYEFFGRPEWRALRRTYGLRFDETRSMDASLMYQAIGQGEVDVIGAYSTDGRIAADDLIVLADDKSAIPPYDAVILTSARTAQAHPSVVKVLRTLVGRLDAPSMRRLNLAVDRDHVAASAAAKRWLATQRR